MSTFAGNQDNLYVWHSTTEYWVRPEYQAGKGTLNMSRLNLWKENILQSML